MACHFSLKMELMVALMKGEDLNWTVAVNNA